MRPVAGADWHPERRQGRDRTRALGARQQASERVLVPGKEMNGLP